MITNLPTDFVTNINSKHRKPVQLCHFHFQGKTYLWSDAPIGISDGLLYDYDPIVESWGTLKDSSNIDQSFSGKSLEIKSTSLSVIMSGEYKDFLRVALSDGLDNSIVELYQWFADTPALAPQLIDIMVAQDPISFSESSMVLQTDLVSVLMKNNPYLWTRNEGEETRDIVIGKISNMPLYDQQTSRTTTIEQDIAYDYTGEVFIGNGVGFNAGPDTMTIDSEIISYSWISASAMNITARGVDSTTARPHIRGALICHPDAVFDYSICAGPVTTVDNLLGNGEEYTQPVTFFEGQDPVIARFTGRPPWLTVSPGVGGTPIIPDPETSTEYGAATKSTYGDEAGAPSSPSSINSASGSATMSITHTVAGGAGSAGPYYGGTPFSENISTSYDKWNVNLSATSIWARSGTGGDVMPDSVVSSVGEEYAFASGTPGYVTKVTVTVSFASTQKFYGCETKIRIVHIEPDGTRNTLEEYTFDELTTAWPGTNHPWSGSDRVFDLDVISWTDLDDTSIAIEMEMVEADETLIGNYAQYAYIDAQVAWEIDYFVDAGSVPEPWQQLLSDFNRDLSSLGALTGITCNVRFGTSVSNATVNRYVMFNGSSLYSDTITSTAASSTKSISPSISSFSELLAAEIGVKHEITGPDTEGVTRTATTTFEYVQWVITYQPGAIDTPDEERVVYADTLTCDVESTLGEDPTPAKVIQYLLEDHSSNGVYIDDASFLARHNEYTDDNYYFNGVLAGDIRLHDAIRQCLQEGMARLLFSQGSIGLLNYSVYENESIDYTISEDDIYLRSRSTKNQPTSTIKNDVTVMYQYNPALDEFEGKMNTTDTDSIVKFERQENREEYTLIQSDVIGNKIAEYTLDRLDHPTTVMGLDMFMPGYVLQKGDRIQFPSIFDGVNYAGHIASINRVMGQGKSSKMNKFEVSITNVEEYTPAPTEAAFVTVWRTTTVDEVVTLPADSVDNDFIVDWGDGTIETITSTYPTHTYSVADDYGVQITGTCPSWRQYNSGDKEKLIKVTSLGTVGWLSFFGAFYGCTNLVEFTAGVTDTSNVTSMGFMFSGCTGFYIDPPDFNGMDTSSVTSMHYMMYGMSTMTGRPDMSGFDTSKVTSMASMFALWGGVLPPDVTSFDTSSVTNMSSMFSNCGMTSSPDVSGFDTSKVTTFVNMFSNVQVDQMESIGVELFDLTSLVSANYMFRGTILSTYGYDEILAAWSAQTVQPNVVIDFEDAQYSDAVARLILTSSPNNWTITDGGPA